MHTDLHPTKPFFHWKDMVVFGLTVAICSFLLLAHSTFAKNVKIPVSATPILAILRPPMPLELLPEPEPVLPEVEIAWRLPEIGLALNMPEIKLVWPMPDLNRAWASAMIGVSSAGSQTSARKPTPSQAVTPKDEKIPFHGIIVQVAGRYEVDPHLIRAIIFAESGFNPRAKSKKGAVGLMQLMPATARALGVQDAYDPAENIDGGVRYFRSLLDRFDGDVQLALAAYNAGARHVRNYEGIPPFRATQLYIKKVLKFQEKYKLETGDRNDRMA